VRLAVASWVTVSTLAVLCVAAGVYSCGRSELMYELPASPRGVAGAGTSGGSAGAGTGGSAADAGTGGGAAGTGGTSSPHLEAPARVVAIGDLHSDIGAARRAFQLAGATDAHDAWVGGALHVVQLGDMIGRGNDERQVLDFLFDVRAKAEAAGGKLHLLVGNHEIMGARVDNQAVGANPFSGYDDLHDLDLSHPLLQFLPDHQKKRGAALMAGGPYAKRFAELPAVLKLGRTVYVHGGVVARWAEYGIDRINREVSRWLSEGGAEPDVSRGVDNGDRVMWTRQFSSGVDASDCIVLERSLAILDATRMIVAHTVHSSITSYCDGKVWAIDVGMSRYYSGPVEVLEIIEDRTLRRLTL
jgi:hypothetical protein